MTRFLYAACIDELTYIDKLLDDIAAEARRAEVLNIAPFLRDSPAWKLRKLDRGLTSLRPKSGHAVLKPLTADFDAQCNFGLPSQPHVELSRPYF